MGKTKKQFLKHKYLKLEKERQRRASKRKNRRRLRKSVRHIQKSGAYHKQLKNLRSKIRKSVFAEYDFHDAPVELPILGEAGLEVPEAIGHFLSLGTATIDSNSSHIQLDLSKCTRLWPSALTLLCSLKQWTELACRVNQNRTPPRISSSSPENADIENYLVHSGFYKYVGRSFRQQSHNYPDSEIVKIRRETERAFMEKREKELIDLVSKYSLFSSDENEYFQCKILPEILNNVIEHGVTCYDQGWWLLGQYHKTHKIISISIADNGMGFRLNLTSGPQRVDIISRIEDIPENDGDFIELAFNEKVSGAHNASTKDEGILRKRHSRGATRGNGLKHIRKTCAICKVRLAVFSHYGYIVFDQDGNLEKKGAMKTRVFAGTLYHLTIPAK